MYKPLLVNLDITKKYNATCAYCSANAGGYNCDDEMNIAELKKLFDEFEKMGILKISVGGEPLCRKDIWDVFSLLDNYTFSKILNTNGLLINDEIAKN